MKKYRPTKLFTALHAKMYQLTAGRVGGKMGRFNVALLTTQGRKSGKKRTLPIGFFDNSQGYIVVASNGGSVHHPAWYFNLKSNPQATFQVMRKVMAVRAEILSGTTREETWQKIVSNVPMYGEYAKETSREIPLVLLHPNDKDQKNR